MSTDLGSKYFVSGCDGLQGFPPVEVRASDARAGEELRREPSRGGQEGQEVWQDGLPSQVSTTIKKNKYEYKQQDGFQQVRTIGNN